MGRSDAVTFTRELVSAWSRLGALVTFESGWESRSNGLSANYEGAIVHHTAVRSSAANPFPGQRLLRVGRPDLPGPLCNSAGPWCPPDLPRIHVLSAGPGNHAGASGGRSMGPLPVSRSFNARVWGHEIDYAGDAPMAPGQYRAALIMARGVCDVLGRSSEYIRAHAESSVTGKWDPGYAPGKTIDMAAFRRDVANLSAVPEDFMATMSDAEKAQLMEVVRILLPGREGRSAGPGWLALVQARDAALRAAAAGGAGEVVAILRPVVIEAVKAGQAAAAGVTAEQIADELAARLSGQ
jgi:hypothetical protein